MKKFLTLIMLLACGFFMASCAQKTTETESTSSKQQLASVKVSYDETNKILKWNAVPGAELYEVYKDNKVICKTAINLFVVGAEEYENEFKAGRSYVVYVVAKAAGYYSSPVSKDSMKSIAINAADPSPVNPNPPTPSSLTAPTIALSGSTISWGAVAGATGYSVYSNGAALTTVATTSLDLSSLLTAAGTYSVFVYATDGTGFSAASNAVSYTVSGGNTNPPTPPTPTTVSDIPTSASDVLLDEDVFEEHKGLCSGKKVYITTCGQADLATATNLIKRATTNYTENNLLKASQVEEGSVVFLVVGASNKGLSGAGTSKEAEETRANDFASAADAGKFTLIVLHLGGAARRGTSSDGIIEFATPSASLVMIIAEGDTDGYFWSTCAQNSIPLYTFTKTANLLGSVNVLFGK